MTVRDTAVTAELRLVIHGTDVVPHPLFRDTAALRHDTHRPKIDAERVAGDWALMYHWLGHDREMVLICGFDAADLTPVAQAARIDQLRREVGPFGRAFTVRPAEMQFWVRFSWISADRCSGRQHALQQAVIRYRPEVVTAAGMLAAAVEHADVAMSAPVPPQTTVTVLGAPTAPGRLGQMFATEQLLRPAGRRHPGGTLVGDGGYLDVTEWVDRNAPELIAPTPGYPAGTFDTLPMVAVGRDGDVAVGTCPPESRYFADIPWPQHPDREDGEVARPDEPFGVWPVVPLQTNFALDIAGQRYCVLFSGWYVDEEIATNFLDPARYDWANRVSGAIHDEAERQHLRRTDRLDEYRMAQIEIATLRAVRRGFKAARSKLNNVGPSQSGFGKFYERYLAAQGTPPPNDTGWTANRIGSRYRYASHSLPHVPQTQGAELVKHQVTTKSLRPGLPLEIVDLSAR